MRCAYTTVMALSYYERQYYEEKKENQTIYCATNRVETLIESFCTEKIFVKQRYCKLGFNVKFVIFFVINNNNWAKDNK